MEKRRFTDWLKYENKISIDDKIKYFEYFVGKLIQDTKNLEDLKSRNYSDLKVMMLLFFTCANDTKLLKIFNNWYAVPYGHVESDVWKYLKENKGQFSFFNLTRFGLELKYPSN